MRKSLQKFQNSFSLDCCFKDVPVTQNESDINTVKKLFIQFFQALHSNIAQRFLYTAILQTAFVLNKSYWPTNVLQKAMFSEQKLPICIRSLTF